MNFPNNWRDRRTIFTPTHYSIANFNTETKNDMKTTFGEDLFLNNLHLIPDPLMKNLADTIITEKKMAPKSKLENNIDMKTDNNMHIQTDYNSPLAGITNFFAGVVNVISNAMFSRRKQADFVDNSGQMAVPSMWQSAKFSDENKILQDENDSNDMVGEILVSEMTDCRKAVAHCQNKIEQVRQLLGSKPVPCTIRTRRRPKKVFVEPGSVEDSFEDAFAPEDFENIANDNYIQYSSPVCYQNQVLHEVQSPRVKVETARASEMVPEPTPVCETTEIVKNVPENETAEDDKLNCDKKEELVASCEDKISKLKALLQERKKKPQPVIEPEPESVPEPKEFAKPPKPPTKVKDKRFKNPNRSCSKRMKARLKKNIQDDVLFANEINSEDLSSVENSPSTCYLEKYIQEPKKPEKEYFDEVSGRFHTSSTTESDDSFQIVFTDSPKLRRASDCDSEDSFIVFENSPDSCYATNDVFGESSDSEEYDSDSDLSDSGCGTMSFNLAPALSKSVCNLADDSLYVDPTEDEVDCANVDRTVSESVSLDEVEIEDTKASSLLDEKKKLLRKNLPAKRVQFSEKPPKVHVMRVWAFAARQARVADWQRLRADKERFDRRIADVDMAVSWVLKPQHRSRVMFQRFMPWWNAQKRKELAEKKEKELQEKLRLEEEKRRAEEDEVGDDTTNNENTLNSEERKADDDNSQFNPKENKKDETKSQNGLEDHQEVKTNKKVNGELTSGELNKKVGKNNKKCDLNEKLNADKVLANETGNKNVCKQLCVNDGSPLNDKIVSLQKGFVAQNILDT